MILKEQTQLLNSLLQVIGLTLIIFVGVDAFYTIVRSQLWNVKAQQVTVEPPPGPTSLGTSSRRDFHIIVDRNLFGSLEKNAAEVSPEDLEQLEPTQLNVALLGTVAGDEQTAYAVIEETDTRTQGLYRVGDGIQDAIVQIILRGKVVLRVGGKDEILTMEESTLSRGQASSDSSARRPRTPGGTVSVRQADIQKSLRNMNELLSQVRIRPHFRNGQPDGLALTRIKPQSIFARMGLRSGDIVQGVNGRPIETPDDILTLYDSLKTGSQLSVQITRSGEPQTINYSIR